MIHLQSLMQSTDTFQKVWESDCGNHRVLYIQLAREDDGIAAHFHPLGEDHAFVLDGTLTYDVSFDAQITADKHALVFGWTNAVHGYHNALEQPLHLLIFATPAQNPSVYDLEQLRAKPTKSIRTVAALEQPVASARVRFSRTCPSNVTNTLVLNRTQLTLQEAAPHCEGELFVTFLP